MFIKKTIFLIFCTVFVVGAAFSQKIAPAKPLRFSVKANTRAGFGLPPLGLDNKAPSALFSPHTLLKPDFSTSNWGFFCRQELKFEKNFKIPFRFRLGSVQQCDRLEGKRVAVTQ
jgi:hypothetical protein